MALSDFYEDFVKMVQTSEPDGMGGELIQWFDGELFRAGLTAKVNRQYPLGEQPALITNYALVFDVGIKLNLNDRVVQVKNGRMYRVISDSGDMETPQMAEVKYGQVSLERIDAFDQNT